MLSLNACWKHGEDDPFLSFVTRNDRLTRLWELQTYSLESDNKIQTTLVFNNTACDTADIGGINIDNISRTEEFADTILNGTISRTQGANGTTNIYNIKITYFLDIQDNGTYTCNGSYSYNDADLNVGVSGSFTANNSWYWETGIKTDWAITLLQFPMLDVSAISETSQPLRYTPAQTFDLRELRQNDLQLEAEMNLSHSIEQSSLPYSIITDLDTIHNCSYVRTIQTDISNTQNWTFIHKD